MSDNTKENNSTKEFIREKIIKKNSFKNSIYKLMFISLSAVIFGFIASVTAMFCEPFVEKVSVKRESNIKESIVIPKDEPETIKKSATSESEAVENIVQSAIEDYAFDINSLKLMYSSLSDLTGKIDESIVSIRTSNIGKDWFDNEIESTGETAGVIIADTNEQMLILASLEAIGANEAIFVKLKDDKEYVASLKKKDYLSDIALLTVDKSIMEESDKANIKVANLGNSYQLKQGDILIAMGAPTGIVHSSMYTNIAYISKVTPLVDMNARLVYLDRDINETLGTYLFNTNGDLVSWLVSGSISGSKYKAGFGISDFKALIERMINEKDSAYLGIEGIDIDKKLEGYGINKGIYIRKVMSDSPAYNVGIQAGDILVAIDDKEIRSMSDYKNILTNLGIQEVSKLKIKRYSRTEYVDLDFELNVGLRQ